MKLRTFEGLFVLGLASVSSTGLVVACSSSSSSGTPPADDAGMNPDATEAHDTSTHDDASNAPDSTPDVQTPCGEAGTCPTGQACVTFTTSGGSCDQTILDGGVCPAGYVTCGANTDGGMFGCAVDSVSQQCTDVPADCTANPSCNTCGTDLCVNCDCTAATATTASCDCLAP
jgi:hypothetical protein